MDFCNSLAGTVKVKITAASPSEVLFFAERANIYLLKVSYADAFSLVITLFRKDLASLERLCEKKGYSLQTESKAGLYWAFQALWKRPVLIIGLLIIFALTLWAPGRIFFVRIEGNSEVANNLILEEASRCGIHFGASRAQVRSEKIKNALMQRLPQLQWAGVNTYGCVAVISVNERETPEQTDKNEGVFSIVASVDAVIREITVTNGTPKCAAGEAVNAGQTLISGYTDCGISIRAGKAEGEVYGETKRTLSAVFPIQYAARTEKCTSIKKYSLIIGKKRINFNNNSGILNSECVRIYSEQYISLPGGFQLPVAIVTEAYIFYDLEQKQFESPDDILQPFMEDLLRQRMTAGRILAHSLMMTEDEELYRVDGIYGCYEMIGVLHQEESLPNYEDN